MSTSLQCGFETTVLGHNSANSVSNHGALKSPAPFRNPRLFLVSKNETIHSDSKQVKPPKKTLRNRKKVIFDKEIHRNGNLYKLNPSKPGLYEEIIHRMIDQFEVAGQKWKKIFVLRFDLHTHYYSPDNRRISRFRDRLFKRLKRKYGFKEIGYCWVRELQSADAQHYHWILFLDGNLIRHSSRINKIIKESWEDETGAYHMPVVEKPYYHGKAEIISEEVIYRASYLAKARGKGYRAQQSKDFQCSRMKISKG